MVGEPSIDAEALWYRLPDSPTTDETVQDSDQWIARVHQRKRDCPGHVAEICTSASGQGNDEARTSTFSTGTPAVSVWLGFLWRLVERPSEPVSTQSQHLRI